MPQMMPMMWLLIFFTSIIFIILLIQHLFFFFNPKIKIKNNLLKSHKYLWNWKW